jgi:cobaltochelatase CobS
MASIEEMVREEMLKALRAQRDAEKAVAEAAPVPEPVFAAAAKTLEAGYKWASDVIGSKVADDFPVRVYADEDWPVAVRGFIPDHNPRYILQPEQSVDILRAWELGDKSLITGPTGAGKSTLIAELCALVRRPFIRVNATGDMDSSMIFGQLVVRDGATVWEDGVATQAVRNGAVLAWDEWEVTPPEIMMGMQWLLEDEGKLFLKEMPGTAADKFIIPHEAFRVVCLGNTLGQGDESGHHAGVNVQNTATLDRFGTCVYLGYLEPKHEVGIITKATALPAKMAEKLVKLAGLIRNGYQTGALPLTMSPRALLSIARKIEFGMSESEAVSKVYMNKLNTTSRRVAQELYAKVYGR